MNDVGYTQTDRQTDRQIHKQTYTQTHTLAHRHIDIQTQMQRPQYMNVQHFGFPSVIMRLSWSYTEKISIALARGWHAQRNECKQIPNLRCRSYCPNGFGCFCKRKPQQMKIISGRLNVFGVKYEPPLPPTIFHFSATANPLREKVASVAVALCAAANI